MRSKDQQVGGAGSERRVPHGVKARIRQAIAQHLREIGNTNWDLVREHTDFAPYIGHAAGEAGKRMFFRWKKELSLPLRPDRTRPKEGRNEIEAHQAWADQTAEATQPEEALQIRVTAGQLMAQGRSALVGYHLVAARLKTGADDIERIRQCALVADPAGIAGFAACDPQLLSTAVKLQHDNAQALTCFLAAVTRFQQGEEFMAAILSVIETELADVPEHRDRVIAGLERLLERYEGPR